jgi:hypothetical protein
LSIPPSFASTFYFLWLVPTFLHWLYLPFPFFFSNLLYIVCIFHILHVPTSFISTILVFPFPLWLTYI